MIIKNYEVPIMWAKKKIRLLEIVMMTLVVTFIWGYPGTVNAATKITGSTNMIVVNVTDYAGVHTSNPEGYIYQDDVLIDFYYTPYRLQWWWTSPWPAGPLGSNSMIWSIKSYDNGQTWRAAAWDYARAGSPGYKELAGNAPAYWGVMLTGLCADDNPAGCKIQNYKVRSNIMFKSIYE